MRDAKCTRDQLLESACEIFAEKGFREATVADICGRAGANIAAVNYHFGDKEKLYAEVWKLSFHRSLEAYPPHAGIDETSSPEDKLRAHVKSVLSRIFDEGKHGHSSKILLAEMGNPSGPMLKVMEEAISPQKKRLQGIVRELIGKGASNRDVDLCVLSVINQCLGFGHRRILIDHMFRGRPDIETLSDHITRFSLAGIRAAREGLE